MLDRAIRLVWQAVDDWAEFKTRDTIAMACDWEPMPLVGRLAGKPFEI